MKRHDVFQSTYLAQADITQPTRATIEGVTLEKVGQGEEQETKAILHFSGGRLKAMVLNNINWTALESAYGDESDFWTGKPVEIYVDPNVMFGKKRVGGLRLRVPQNGSGFQAQPSFVTWDAALTAAQAAGVTKDQITGMLRQKGLAGYKPDRDWPAIQEMIARATPGDAFEGSVNSNAEEVPF